MQISEEAKLERQIKALHQWAHQQTFMAGPDLVSVLAIYAGKLVATHVQDSQARAEVVAQLQKNIAVAAGLDGGH